VALLQVNQILTEIKARLETAPAVSDNIFLFKDVETESGVDEFIVIGLPRTSFDRLTIGLNTINDTAYQARTQVPIDIVTKIPSGMQITDAVESLAKEVFLRLSLNIENTIIENSSFSLMQYDLESHSDKFGRVSFVFDVTTYLSANFE
jgi:hypothetical protein